jgi:hypothetical protein
MRVSLAILWLLGANAPPSLGTVLKREGYQIRPPADFRMGPNNWFDESQVGVIGSERRSAGQVSVVLSDRDAEDAATLLISMVDGSFRASPSSRDEFSTATVLHFAERLNLTSHIESVELVREKSPRVELTGTVRHEGQLRYLLVAAMEGRGRHAVIVFSAPAGRWQALKPALEASLDTFASDTPVAGELTRSLAGAAAGALAGGLFVSLAVWRKRRRAKL